MPSAVANGARGADDDIVLTGLSGRLPQSDSIEEFAQQLFDGVDLVTADDRRWTPGNYCLHPVFAFFIYFSYQFLLSE